MTSENPNVPSSTYLRTVHRTTRSRSVIFGSVVPDSFEFGHISTTADLERRITGMHVFHYLPNGRRPSE